MFIDLQTAILVPMLKILIVRTSALGDIIHTFPALMALRAAFPDAHIGWAVEKRFASLLENIAEIDTIHPVELKKGMAARLAAIKELRAPRYDISIDFQGLLKSALIGVAAGAKHRVGFSRSNSRECAALFYTQRVERRSARDNITTLNTTLVEELYRRLQGEELQSEVSFPRFTSAGDCEAVDALLRDCGQPQRFALINPGGAWHSKLWGAENYAQLARGLKSEFGLDSVLSCFGAERALGEEINAHLESPLPICDSLSYTQQAEISARAAVAIGPDTGPLHIAHAINCPTLLLFGASDSWRNTPSGNRAWALQAPLECPPCWKKTCPKYETTRCMESITAALVLQKVGEILNAG